MKILKSNFFGRIINHSNNSSEEDDYILEEFNEDEATIHNLNSLATELQNIIQKQIDRMD